MPHGGGRRSSASHGYVCSIHYDEKEASEEGEKLAFYRIEWDKLKNKEIDIDSVIEKIQPLLSENEDLIMHEGLGYLYYKKGMFETAMPYLTKATEAGFDDSQTMLADIYYNGRLGDKDIDKALDWIIKAINLGTIKRVLYLLK